MNFFKNKIKLNNKKNLSNEGVVLFFTVILTSIILSISLGLVSVTVNELNFSTYSSNSNEAFYAANTGAECALYNDFKQSGGGEVKVNCAGNIDIDFWRSPEGLSEFTLIGLGKNNNACAKVTITRGEWDDDQEIDTKIISKGYNLGGDDNCDSTSPRKLEREIELNY